MRSFKDKTGVEWVIDLNIGTVQRVKSTSSFNLYDVELAEKVWSDFGEFFELLFLVIEPQAVARSVDAAVFGENLAANCLITAKDAFFEEWADFFQNLQQPDKAALLEKLMRMWRKALELTQAKLASDDMKKQDSRIEGFISQRLNAEYGKWEASLDSILGHSPGDNSKPLHRASDR